MASASKTIADLRKGETAVISAITDNDLALKLLEMGCLPGEPVTLQHVAPLGDPICIRISGYSLSLRKREAASIQLQWISNETSALSFAVPIQPRVESSSLN